MRQKNCSFAICFYFFGKSIKKHSDSLCENNNNNELNVWTRVKNAVRMRAFPASGANLHVPPHVRYQNKLDSGREIQKSKLHTQKIRLEFHEHKAY